MSFQRRTRAGTEGQIHPVARPAFLGAQEAHPLQLELDTDQRIQVEAASENVSAQNRRRSVVDAEPFAQGMVNFRGEERDLALVIGLVSEVAVAFEAATGDAPQFRDLDHWMLPGRTAVMAYEVVAG